MYVLADVLRQPVVDSHGGSTHLVDVAVDLGADDYPPLTLLLVPGKDRTPLALSCPASLDPARGFLVESLAAARPLADDELAGLVLLDRDVQDALVLDLAQERAVRVNDVVLGDRAGRLVLAAADVSAAAVLRRLTHGLVKAHLGAGLLDWRDVEFLRGTPRAVDDGRSYHRRVARLQPMQIARLADALPYLHAAELLALLPDPLAADVLEDMSPERQVQVLVELDPAPAVRLLAEMASDVAADVLGRLTLNDAAQLLERLPPERAVPIQDLLRYPPDTAGGIMTNDLVVAPIGRDVAAALVEIRERLARPDFVYFVYLVDSYDACRLKGVVTLRDLLLAEPTDPIEALMKADLHTVGPREPALEVAHRIADYGLNALPVVDPDGRLLGIVTVDAALAQIAPETWRDRMPRVFS